MNLRFPTHQDQVEYLRLRRDSRALHAQWEPTPPKGVDPYGAQAFATILASCENETTRRLLVCRKNDGRIVGQIAMNGIMRGCFHNAILGYWVGAKYQGQGFMTEGISLMCRYAFRTMKLHRLEANIQPENAPSIRLIERCGFRYEGFSPRYLKIRGRWRDHQRYVLLAEEWSG